MTTAKLNDEQDVTPLRVSEAGLAWITRTASVGSWEVLVQWNPKWQAYSLIGGHREGDESFRDCCIREIVEELAIEPERDFRVSLQPAIATIEYVAYSVAAKVPTQYRFEVFQADLVSEHAKTKIDSMPENTWVTHAQIENRQAADGRRITEQVDIVKRAVIGGTQ